MGEEIITGMMGRREKREEVCTRAG